jgi:hypothetical protein
VLVGLHCFDLGWEQKSSRNLLLFYAKRRCGEQVFDDDQNDPDAELRVNQKVHDRKERKA